MKINGENKTVTETIKSGKESSGASSKKYHDNNYLNFGFTFWGSETPSVWYVEKNLVMHLW